MRSRKPKSIPLYDPNLAAAITETGRIELRKLIEVVAEVIEFDYQNCDFGPALGTMIHKRNQLLKELDKTLKTLK